MRFADRMGHLKTAASFEMLARGKALEAQGRSIVHLGIGEPDFDTPSFIRRAAAEALEAGYTHYGPAPGLPEFRRTIAAQWRERRGIACEAANVVVTPGAKPILFFAMVALLEPGDEVLIPSPAFPNYNSIAEFLGARVVPVPLLPAKGFDVDLAALEARITPRTRILLLNSPHNPTGGVIAPATLAAIAELAKRHDFTVISDEIYAGMVYDGESPSIATLPGMAERTVVVDGFSKTYAMTGWRIGFAAAPVKVASAMSNLQDQVTSNPTSFAQKGAIAAFNLDPRGVEEMRAEFHSRRDLIVDLLRAIPGVTLTTPGGAFYAFPDVSHYLGGTIKTDGDLANHLLETAQLAMMPGYVFYGPGHLRISYAASRDSIKKGVERLGEALSKIAR